MGKEGHVPKNKSKKKKKSPAKTERKAASLSTPDDVDEFVAGRHELLEVAFVTKCKFPYCLG